MKIKFILLIALFAIQGCKSTETQEVPPDNEGNISSSIDYYNSGLDFYNSGNLTKAKEDLSTALSMGFKKSEFFLGAIALKQGREADALSHFFNRAVAGDDYAQLALADIFASKKAALERAPAIYWYAKSASSGNDKSIQKLNETFENSYFNPSNYDYNANLAISAYLGMNLEETGALTVDDCEALTSHINDRFLFSLQEEIAKRPTMRDAIGIMPEMWDGTATEPLIAYAIYLAMGELPVGMDALSEYHEAREEYGPAIPWVKANTLIEKKKKYRRIAFMSLMADELDDFFRYTKKLYDMGDPAAIYGLGQAYRFRENA